jgi:DNA-binding XRE family transcriptional regulator
MARRGQSFTEYLDTYKTGLSEKDRELYEIERVRFALINDMIELRKAENLTQSQLSERSGVSQPEISRIENGAINPTIGTMARIANGLGARIGLVSDVRHA